MGQSVALPPTKIYALQAQGCNLCHSKSHKIANQQIVLLIVRS